MKKTKKSRIINESLRQNFVMSFDIKFSNKVSTKSFIEELDSLVDKEKPTKPSRAVNNGFDLNIKPVIFEDKIGQVIELLTTGDFKEDNGIEKVALNLHFKNDNDFALVKTFGKAILGGKTKSKQLEKLLSEVKDIEISDPDESIEFHVWKNINKFDLGLPNNKVFSVLLPIPNSRLSKLFSAVEDDANMRDAIYTVLKKEGVIKK